MGLGTVLDDFVEEKMLNLNTCFIGKVESVKAGKAKVQPLTMFKTYGGEAKQPAVAAGRLQGFFAQNRQFPRNKPISTDI